MSIDMKITNGKYDNEFYQLERAIIKVIIGELENRNIKQKDFAEAIWDTMTPKSAYNTWNYCQTASKSTGRTRSLTYVEVVKAARFLNTHLGVLQTKAEMIVESSNKSQ